MSEEKLLPIPKNVVEVAQQIVDQIAKRISEWNTRPVDPRAGIAKAKEAQQ